MARPPKDVTETELEILKKLWDEGPQTIRRLTESLYKEGGASEYATIQKLLERLESKDFVSRRKEGPAHTFFAVVDREELIGRRLQEVADTLCGGSMTPLLTHLLGERSLSGDERRALHEFVAQLSRAKSAKSQKR